MIINEVNDPQYRNFLHCTFPQKFPSIHSRLYFALKNLKNSQYNNFSYKRNDINVTSTIISMCSIVLNGTLVLHRLLYP